jgi:hypothetical protein
MTMRVRRAIAADAPWLLDQLLAFDQFFGSTRSLFPSEEHAESMLLGLINDQPFVIAEKDEPYYEAPRPVGFICGAIMPHPYNPALIVLSEMFWWVAEEYRGSRAGLLLLNEFVAIGKRSAHWVIMTLEQESTIDPDHLYRRGFRLKELSYLLETDATASAGVAA